MHCDASGIARHYPKLNNDVVTRAYVEYLRREHAALTRDVTDDFGWIYKSSDETFAFVRCVPSACGEVDPTGKTSRKLWISDGGFIRRNLWREPHADADGEHRRWRRGHHARPVRRTTGTNPTRAREQQRRPATAPASFAS